MTQDEKDRRNKKAREKRAKERESREPIFCFNCGVQIIYNKDAKGKQRTKFCSESCYLIGRKKDPDFYIKKREYDKKYDQLNKDKIAEKRKSYWTSPRSQYYSRVSHLKVTYGITEVQYRDLMDVQKGCCAICGDSLESPYVDHCHDTGTVRGLLCQLCNTAIGHFRENVEIMKRAICYVESYEH